MTDTPAPQSPMVSDTMIDCACQAMAIEVARQEGITLTPAGYRQGKAARPRDHALMVCYVRAALTAALAVREPALTTPTREEYLLDALGNDGLLYGPGIAKPLGVLSPAQIDVPCLISPEPVSPIVNMEEAGNDRPRRLAAHYMDALTAILLEEDPAVIHELAEKALSINPATPPWESEEQ